MSKNIISASKARVLVIKYEEEDYKKNHAEFLKKAEEIGNKIAQVASKGGTFLEWVFNNEDELEFMIWEFEELGYLVRPTAKDNHESLHRIIDWKQYTEKELEEM